MVVDVQAQFTEFSRVRADLDLEWVVLWPGSTTMGRRCDESVAVVVEVESWWSENIVEKSRSHRYLGLLGTVVESTRGVF
jgi:hypothetical protein